MAIGLKVLAGFSIVTGLVCIAVVCVLYTVTGGDIPFEHGVIIDAGSTHSEALLYRWEGDKYFGTGKVKEVAKCSVKRGIATYSDPREAGESLLPCLKEVSEKVDEGKRPNIPVYVAATGGMRLLNLTNSYQTMAIIIGLQCSIPQSNMKVMDVSIINGHDEGLFAWITTNYLSETIQEKNHKTLGACDMGGASTQISFEVDKSAANNTNVASLKLYGEPYYVYSVSYLCYGSTEIFRRFLASLVKDLSTHLTVDNPCGNRDNKLIYDARWLFDKPCTTTKETAKWFVLYPDQTDKNYTFVGTANEKECRAAIENLFEPAECRKSYSECFTPIDPLSRPNSFIAFSSYYWTAIFLEAIDKSMHVYETNLQTHCQKNWNDIKPEDFAEGAQADLPRYCFLGTMIHVILTKGYGYNKDTWKEIQFARKINDISLGWTLGYMTNSTNAIPAEEPKSPVLGLAAFICLIVVGAVLLLVGIVICIKPKSRSQNLVA